LLTGHQTRIISREEFLPPRSGGLNASSERSENAHRLVIRHTRTCTRESTRTTEGHGELGEFANRVIRSGVFAIRETSSLTPRSICRGALSRMTTAAYRKTIGFVVSCRFLRAAVGKSALKKARSSVRAVPSHASRGACCHCQYRNHAMITHTRGRDARSTPNRSFSRSPPGGIYQRPLESVPPPMRSVHEDDRITVSRVISCR